jgi:hypothetical protein
LCIEEQKEDATVMMMTPSSISLPYTTTYAATDNPAALAIAPTAESKVSVLK